MYIQQLTIEIKSSVDKNELVDHFHSLLYSFRKNGQSQTSQLASFLSDNLISCNIETLEKNSLAKKYNSHWVENYIEELERLTSSKLQFKTLGTTFEKYSGACTCKKHIFFILYTNFLNDEGSLVCGTCSRVVPLYRIATLDTVVRQNILTWERNYMSCDELQINSTVGEKWATKQMTDHSSQLSNEGITICSTIKSATGRPAYYYLFNYRRLKTEQDKKRVCPSCNGQWLLKKPLHDFYHFKCDRCELISSLTSNN